LTLRSSDLTAAAGREGETDDDDDDDGKNGDDNDDDEDGDVDNAVDRPTPCGFRASKMVNSMSRCSPT
jgi:hypothetical protein